MLRNYTHLPHLPSGARAMTDVRSKQPNVSNELRVIRSSNDSYAFTLAGDVQSNLRPRVGAGKFFCAEACFIFRKSLRY